jgi:hypothetical protein
MDSEPRPPSQKSPISSIEEFKQEVNFLNRKYDWFLQLEKSNFFEVNQFIFKYSLGLGWWALLLLLLIEILDLIPVGNFVIRYIFKR